MEVIGDFVKGRDISMFLKFIFSILQKGKEDFRCVLLDIFGIEDIILFRNIIKKESNFSRTFIDESLDLGDSIEENDVKLGFFFLFFIVFQFISYQVMFSNGLYRYMVIFYLFKFYEYFNIRDKFFRNYFFCFIYDGGIIICSIVVGQFV